MKTIVVTGGIATGKSTACRLLLEAVPRAVLFDCDVRVHELLTNETIKQRIEAEFGEDVFTEENEIDRPLLGEIVFADADRRRSLEGILHPEVRDSCLQARDEASRSDETPLFVADVPLYYETDFSIDAERVLVIAASRDTRLRRLEDRAGLDFENAERMLEIQMPLEQKMNRADRVIWNDQDIEALKKQIYYFTLLELENQNHG